MFINASIVGIVQIHKLLEVEKKCVIYKIEKHIIVWFFQLGPLTHFDKMEPSLVNKRCNIFMNENETLVEERSEHERSERSKTSQILNFKMMIQCNYL